MKPGFSAPARPLQIARETGGSGGLAEEPGVERSLADDTNLLRLEPGDLKGFRGYGGHYRQSPVRLSPPSSGRCTAVVIPTGGRVEARGAGKNGPRNRP